MATELLEITRACTWYEELIDKCGKQLTSLQSKLPTVSETDLPDDSTDETIDISITSFSRSIFEELSRKISRCSDAEFLGVLRNELQRQLGHHKKRMQQLTQAKVRTGRPQTYFKISVNSGQAEVTKYYHVDGDDIARILELTANSYPTLLITGRDDDQIRNAKGDISASAVDKVTVEESDFDALWFQHGGFPYVRPTRLARRQLFTVLAKKH